MNRKDYQKPTMQIVKLRHTGILMQSGGEKSGRSSVQNYTWHDDIDEE